MNLKSKHFDSIRSTKKALKEVKSIQTCDWDHCKDTAPYPAPAADGSTQQRYFCIQHIKVYNKSFNFFEKMSDEEITEYKESSTTGHRPTWTLGTRRAGTQGIQDKWKDPLELMKHYTTTSQRTKIAQARTASPGQISALDILDLTEVAKADEVKARYKKLIKKFHPDANGGDRKYEARLQRSIQAYEYLKASGFC